jgi:hypothetical protein
MRRARLQNLRAIKAEIFHPLESVCFLNFNSTWHCKRDGSLTALLLVEPNRKWFTNSRVISQESLSSFRDAVAQQTKDPHSYLLKTNKLPMSLIRDQPIERKDGLLQHKAKMVIDTASFSSTFGSTYPIGLHCRGVATSSSGLYYLANGQNRTRMASSVCSKIWAQKLKTGHTIILHICLDKHANPSSRQSPAQEGQA